jgi:hypothetical protein
MEIARQTPLTPASKLKRKLDVMTTARQRLQHRFNQQEKKLIKQQARTASAEAANHQLRLKRKADDEKHKAQMATNDNKMQRVEVELQGCKERNKGGVRVTRSGIAGSVQADTTLLSVIQKQQQEKVADQV